MYSGMCAYNDAGIPKLKMFESTYDNAKRMLNMPNSDGENMRTKTTTKMAEKTRLR